MDALKKMLLYQMMEEKTKQAPKQTEVSLCLRALREAKALKKYSLLQRYMFLVEAVRHVEAAALEANVLLAESAEDRQKQVAAVTLAMQGIQQILLVKSTDELLPILLKYAIYNDGTRIFRYAFQSVIAAIITNVKTLSELITNVKMLSESQSVTNTLTLPAPQEESVAQEELQNVLPTPPPGASAEKAGRQALAMIREAAKRKVPFRHAPVTRLALLQKASSLAKIYQPENWESVEKPGVHSKQLDKHILGAKAILDASTWSDLVQQFTNHYNPMQANSSVRTEKKAMKVMLLFLEYKIKEFALYMPRPTPTVVATPAVEDK